MREASQKFEDWHAFIKPMRAEEHEIFERVELYCMFIGHGRSGHSLVGAFLNAHKDVVIAQELNALKYVADGCSRNQLYHLLLERDRWFTQSDNQWHGYDYQIPNQWQGKFESLIVIGDKKGGTSTRMLNADPSLLGKLKQVVAVPIRVIQVVRNPYDNICTMFLNSNFPIEKSVEKYFSYCKTIVEAIKTLDDSEFCLIKHEDLIAQPEKILEKLCRFLKLSDYPAYISDCASIVFESPKKSRHKVEWPRGLCTAIQDRMNAFEFLAGYSFDS